MVLLLAPVAHAQAPIIVREPYKSVRISATAERVVSCESNWRADVYGDNGNAYGPAQFWKSSFYRMKQDAIDAGAPFWYFEYTNPTDQVILLNWALNNGYGREWTCWKKQQGSL